MREGASTSATSPYGWTKVMIEQVLSDVATTDERLGFVVGDAGHALVLERTHIERAILLVVALRDPQTSRRVVEYARRTNERLGIVARAHTRDGADYLRKAGANEVVIGEEELAIEMTGYALHRLGVSPQEVALIARGLRAR